MILAIDIGNTTVAVGGIENGQLRFTGRMDTVRSHTAREYGPELQKLLEEQMGSGAADSFSGAVLTSVVPQITQVLAECAAAHCGGKKPILIADGIQTGITMAVDKPQGVGKDRIVDAAYAAAHYPLPVVTVDLGTATTFNVVDDQRRFLGGVICAGVATGINALADRCAQLPEIRLQSPDHVVGKFTEDCILIGAVMGTAAMIDGLTQRIEEEIGSPVTLVITGGMAHHVVPFCRHGLHEDPELLMKGLEYLYKLNCSEQNGTKNV